jgi:hypothetical protein
MKKILFLTLAIALGVFVFTGGVHASSTGWEYLDSAEEEVETGIGGTLMAPPIASPISGTYTSTQSVTLSAAGSSSIRYTTNNTNPTCSTGTVYSSAISVSSTTTIKAISCYPQSENSSVVTFAYTITAPPSPTTPPPPGGPGGGTPDQTPPPSTNPSDYKTRNRCIGADFYWYDNACHATPQVTTEENGKMLLEGTREHYQSQKDNLEELLKRKRQQKSQTETITSVINVLLVTVGEKEDKDTYNEALLSILEKMEEVAAGLGEEIEELEDLLGIVREKLSLATQREQIQRMKTIINALLTAAGDNETAEAGLNNLLSTLNGIEDSIDERLSE